MSAGGASARSRAPGLEPADRLGRVRSLVRALSLLDHLADHQGGLRLSQLARLAGLPRSTAHRLLNTMETLRYAEFDVERGRWVAGLQTFNLHCAVSQSRDLGRLARPTLQGLTLEVGEAASLAVARGDGMQCVEHVPSRDRSRGAPIGQGAQMHTTAAGKVLLASMPTAEMDAFLARRPLVRRTPTSITDPLELAAELEQVRARRYATEDEEHAPGECAVAAAVVDTRGCTRAALAISFPRSRMNKDRTLVLAAAAVSAANRLTGELGRWLAV